MTLEQARERVERGALLLDATHPDWYRKIQVSTLKLDSKCFCVLGQVVGHFRFWSHVVPRDQLPWEYGFDVQAGNNPTGSYKLLQDCWIAVIADRVVAAQLRDEAQDAEVTVKLTSQANTK